MNVLFIVTELNSANGICTQSVMREFLANGHSVYCITNNEPHDTLYPDIKYSFVKPRLVYRLLKSKKRSVRIVGTILNKLKLLISYPTWPLISPSYTTRIYEKAEKMCRDEKIDIVIPIYTQIDTLIAAKKIKKKHPKIKYVPYFLDSLSGGYGPKYLSKAWLNRRGSKWEKRLLGTADKIIMMRSSFEHYFSHRESAPFFNKTVFLDLPLITKPLPATSSSKSDGLTHLVYVGTIPAHIRDPEIFLKVFCKIENQNYRLHIFGTSTCSELLERYARKDPRIVIEGPVSHDKALQQVTEADVLVNLGNNISSMTPSKIFEYMSYGKPILSTMPIKNEPSIPYLKKYPLAHLIDYSDTDIDALARETQSWIDRTTNSTIPFSLVEEIFSDNTPKRFLETVIPKV